MFRDRLQAAQLLARKLSKFKGKNPLVLAIPRGAVPMADVIADHLEGELDIVLVHKLRAPFQPELAIGSVDESGQVFLGSHASMVGAKEEYVREETEEQVRILKKRRTLYTPIHPRISAANRTVIVVDDGIATGSSMIAALRMIRQEKPEKLVAAAAVAPFEGLQQIKNYADEVEVLLVPEDFYAVGQFFESFDQVSDDEVIQILKESRTRAREKI
jgi:predicted phosphoribosyltransferase